MWQKSITTLHSKNAAFTLAEVLITLGIIGVVAAMTIPTLIANTRSQQYRSQFKKTLSTLNQAARMAQAQYDFDFSEIDDLCYRVNSDPYAYNPNTSKSICALFNGTLQGNWLLINDEPNLANRNLYSAYDIYDYSSTGSVFNLNDGSTIFVGKGSLYNCTINKPCEGAIDVNGVKSKPNKLVQCSTASDTKYLYSEDDGWQNVDTCTVGNASIGDLFPVYFYDSTVVPATNAAAYVLNTAK